MTTTTMAQQQTFSPQRLFCSLTHVFPHPIFLAVGLEAIIRGKEERCSQKQSGGTGFTLSTRKSWSSRSYFAPFFFEGNIRKGLWLAHRLSTLMWFRRSGKGIQGS